MYYLTAIDTNGRVVSQSSSQMEAVLDMDIPESASIRVYEEAPPNSYYDINNSRWVNIPARPTKHHTFNWDTKVWEDLRSLQEVKDQKWASIKEARTLAENSGFTWDMSEFDSDATSQSRISGSATLALIAKQSNQLYEVTWTLKDNTTRVLSADDMIAVGLALGAHVQTVFNHGQQLQQQINVATTKEVIAAINWE